MYRIIEIYDGTTISVQHTAQLHPAIYDYLGNMRDLCLDKSPITNYYLNNYAENHYVERKDEVQRRYFLQRNPALQNYYHSYYVETSKLRKRRSMVKEQDALYNIE